MSKYYKKSSHSLSQTFSLSDYDKRLDNVDKNTSENLRFEIRFFFISLSVLFATYVNIYKNVRSIY